MVEPVWKNSEFVEHYNRLYGVSEAEIRAFLNPLQLSASDRVVDFGCGNGSIIALAAVTVAFACGIDGSQDQVALAERNLHRFGNVEIRHAAFLDVCLPPAHFTRGWARKALHHLTDPQKDEFFARIGAAFTQGSLFLLEDGMYDFPREHLDAQWPRVMREAEAYYGDRWAVVRHDVEHTLRCEFPTGTQRWLQAMSHAGFRPLEVTQRTCFYGSILARKETT